jgi:hypothetical protein
MRDFRTIRDRQLPGLNGNGLIFRGRLVGAVAGGEGFGFQLVTGPETGCIGFVVPELDHGLGLFPAGAGGPTGLTFVGNDGGVALLLDLMTPACAKQLAHKLLARRWQ